MIEIAVLAASVVSSFIVPLVKQGGEKLAAELAEQTSESTAKGLVATARKLWDKVRGKSEGSDAQIVDLFEKDPDKMSAALEAVVKGLLEKDPAFHKELSDLVEADEGGAGSRYQLMGKYNAVLDARNTHVSGGSPTFTAMHLEFGASERASESNAPKDG
jgi:hypothetical protein